MRECINLHIGQAGSQVGFAIWETYCLEHKVQPNGFAMSDEIVDDDDIDAFFMPTKKGNFVPRCIFIDSEASVLDQCRIGYYRELYHPDQIVSGVEDASNNFAKGFNGKSELIATTMGRMRKIAESCDRVNGFFLTHSFGGGSGSGMTSKIMEEMMKDYSNKVIKIQLSIYPSPRMSTSIVEPYNTVLHTHSSIEAADTVLLIDNEAIYNMCTKKLDMEHPTYTNINRIVAQALGVVTSGLRFTSSNTDIQQFVTNLIPYPRIHFPVLNFAPTISNRRVFHENINIKDLTFDCFKASNQLVHFDPRNGKYMACAMFYRGDVHPQQVNAAIINVKEKGHVFVDWCPTAFKICFCPSPPITVPGGDLGSVNRQLSMITNTTAVLEVWVRTDYKFDLMFGKRAFVHWFVGEGMEEGEFSESRADMSSLETDYLEVGAETKPDDGGGNEEEF